MVAWQKMLDSLWDWVAAPSEGVVLGQVYHSTLGCHSRGSNGMWIDRPQQYCRDSPDPWMRMCILAAEMSFLCRLLGSSLRDRERSPDIQRQLVCVKGARRFDLAWNPVVGTQHAISHPSWGCFGIPQKELEHVAKRERLDYPILLGLLQPRHSPW